MGIAQGIAQSADIVGTGRNDEDSIGHGASGWPTPCVA
jgi:hypothetical protein